MRRSVHRRRGRHRRQGRRRRWPAGSSARSPRPLHRQPGAHRGNRRLLFGETIQKTGPKKYKITNGGFTTCVQPTPRWELHSSTVVLNLDDTAAAQRGVSSEGRAAAVHPVPVLPDQAGRPRNRLPAADLRGDTLRGQSIHNAFFWAIDRSEDATALYDWYSNDGQGFGSEYRYNFGAGSNGNLKTYWLDQKATTDDGRRSSPPAAATSCAAPPTSACRAGFAPGRTSTTSPASPRCRR